MTARLPGVEGWCRYRAVMERIGLAPGAEIGGYTIIAPLGSGGMGTVYRALDGGGNAVALKLLHPHVGADPASRERLRREVLALQRLRHPGVAAVLDAEADSTEAFIVTELVAGQDLQDAVQGGGPLDAEALHAFAEGLRSALHAVHAAGVVHRDLKPSNVLLGHDGPVLIDFGIAQAADDPRVTSTGLVVGTPGYLAPELLDGGEPSEATDWWGWAALLAFAATGRAPFGTRPLESVLVRTRSGDADLVGLGPVTGGALWDALAPDPDDRPTPEEVVAALVEAARTGEVFDPDAVPDPGPATSATVALGAGAATVALGTGATAVVPLGGDTAATVAVPGQVGPGPTVALGGAGAAPVNDGSTRAFDATGGGDDGRAGELPGAYPPGGDDDGAWPDPEQDDEPGYQRPVPHHRWGTLLALALAITAAAALRPGYVAVVLPVLLVVARTVGSASEALHDRRERSGGVRRGDVGRAAVAAPWHLVRSAVTLIPSLLVGVSLAVIVLGVGWWLVGSGALEVGPLTAGVDGPAPRAVSVLAAAAFLLGLLGVWWGPVSDTTRIGTRRLLDAVAPGTTGAGVIVVLALAAAGLVVYLVATGSAADFGPLPTPTLPDS